MILQTIHKYKRTLFGVIMALLMAVVMSGFGLNMIQTWQGQARDVAVSVGDQSMSFQEVDDIRRMTRLSGQALSDRVVNSALLDHVASELGFAAGTDSVRLKLEAELFGGALDSAQYAAFLRQMGMSAAQFERTLHKDAVRGQFVQLINDLSLPSTIETRRSLERQERTLTVQTLTFKPEDFIAKAAEPSVEEIESYYNDHGGEFEIPAGASYNYVLFTPAGYESVVEIPTEDIELYYSDNEREFTIKEAANVRVIRLDYPKDATDAQKAEVTERANQVHSRTKAGESFEALALEFSDDLATKSKGGLLGWVEKGERSREFDSQVFKLTAPGIPDLVSSATGYEIVKLEEHRPATVKPLDSVRAEIRAKLAKEEAPAYAAMLSQERYDEWTKSGLSLSDFAKQKNLTVASTNGILNSDTDPEPTAKGLTAAVLNSAPQKQQLNDVGQFAAIVELTKHRETDIAPLSEVRAAIVQKLKERSARQLARNEANSLVETLKKEGASDLAAPAKRSGAAHATIEAKGFVARPELDNDELRRKMAAVDAPSTRPLGVYEIANNLVIPAVTAIKKPEGKEIDEKVALMTRYSRTSVADQVIRSILNREKSGLDITVSPRVAADQSVQE